MSNTPTRFVGPRSALVLLLVASCGAWAQAAPEQAQVTLARERQEHVWNIEHLSFVLETYFGKPFMQAVVARDRETLLSYFLEDFGGTLPAPDGGRTRRVGLVSELRRSVAAGGARPADATGMAGHLAGSLASFERVDRSRLQVTHLDMLDGRKDGWIAEALMTVVGVGADQAPLEHVSQLRLELRFSGEEALKQPGRLVRRLEVLSEAERRAPRKLMEEVTAKSGIAEIPLPDNWKLPTHLARMHRYQFAVEDYDRDGFVDIAVAATNGRVLLLRSLRGRRFEDVAQAVGLRSLDNPPGERMQKALAGWIDYDNDGYPDLLVGNRLYHNEGGRRFADVTQASGLYFERSPFGTVVADYDGDGLLDLYIVNQKGFKPRAPGKRPWVGDESAGTVNHLWRNVGGGKFRNVTVQAQAGGGRHQTFAGASFFLDDDAFPDLYLANDFGNNVLLRNRGDGTFDDVTDHSGTGDFSTSMGVSAGDLDNDGRSELYVANMYSKMGRRIVAHIRAEDYPEGLYEMIHGSLAGNRLYRPADGAARFEDITEGLGVNKVGWAFAPAMVDLDADGWLDLYATTGFNSADPEKPDG